MNLTGKTALITGASRGIGREIARQFAAAGARVAVHYGHSLPMAEETLAGLTGEGHLLVQADLTAPAAIAQMVDTVTAFFGRLDILVNNAGIFESHPLDSVDYQTWQEKWTRTIQTNLLGAANTAYWAGRHMIDHGGGKIINVGSRGAYRGEPDAPAYGASKAALHAMSQSLAVHLGAHGIFVTAVAPGFVQTEMARDALKGERGEQIRRQSPHNRVATPQDVARTVLFLAADGSEWLTGGVVDVNGASYLR